MAGGVARRAGSGEPTFASAPTRSTRREAKGRTRGGSSREAPKRRRERRAPTRPAGPAGPAPAPTREEGAGRRARRSRGRRGGGARRGDAGARSRVSTRQRASAAIPAAEDLERCARVGDGSDGAGKAERRARSRATMGAPGEAARPCASPPPPRGGSEPPASRATLDAALDEMRRREQDPSGGTRGDGTFARDANVSNANANVSNANANVSNANVSNANASVFARLAPLVLLRTLPLRAWDDDGWDREREADLLARLLRDALDVAPSAATNDASSGGAADEARRVAAEHGRARPDASAATRRRDGGGGGGSGGGGEGGGGDG